MKTNNTEWARETTPLRLAEINKLLGTDLRLHEVSDSVWDVVGGAGLRLPAIVGTPTEVYEAVYYFQKGVEAGLLRAKSHD